jgi:tRNA (cmo5U34)-methyltransferase
MTTTKEFYDSFSSQYTEAILKCVPRYEEMLATLFLYIPNGFAPKSILELGCGTGNLSSLIVRHFPEAKLTAVDISGEIISKCKDRLKGNHINYLQEDFTKLNFPDKSFDLIISSIAIHHLADPDKKKLFQSVYEWLVNGGVFTFSDQFKGETDDLYQKHIELWKIHAIKNDVTDKDWKTWIEHQKLHDYHSSLKSHLDWLKNCGFKSPDCVWRYLLWSVIYAKKV